MGFFGSLVKGIGNAAQDAIKKSISENWKKINSISQNRLEEIYRERGVRPARHNSYSHRFSPCCKKPLYH